MYPRIRVETKKIQANTEFLTGLCRRRGIKVAGVVKAVCGMPAAARAMVAGGAAMLGDSRLENLAGLQGLPVPRLLLRLPMPSQAGDVVRHAEISLNTELKTLQVLGKAARDLKKTHGVLLMLELGDLREGLPLQQVPGMVREIQGIQGLRLLGVGANLTCYGGILPDPQNLGLLVETAQALERQLGLSLPLVSGGNSSSLHLLDQGTLPRGINHLRLGEALLLGRETAFGRPLPGTCSDAFTLEAEIIEAQVKPSLPWGERGLDAFGQQPRFQDRGLRARAILAVGRQDVHPEHLTPLDPGVFILGASSDHLLLDVTEGERACGVGDRLAFRPDYAGLLQLMTSPYVHKEIF
jgi:ornithine racemase